MHGTFPPAATRAFRRGATALALLAALLASTGFGLGTLASYEVADLFRATAAGTPSDPPPYLGPLIDGARGLLLAAAWLAVPAILALAVAGTLGWATADARRGLVAVAAGFATSATLLLLDQLGPSPGGVETPLFLGLSAAAAVLVAPRRAALGLAAAAAAVFLARAWHAAQYPPWFDAGAHLLPQQGAEAAWSALGFLLLASALALPLLARVRGAPPRAAERAAAEDRAESALG